MRWSLGCLLVMVCCCTIKAERLVAGDHAAVEICPRCNATCYPTVSKGTQTRHCWNVETKAICIPRVTFPWQAGHKGTCKDGCTAPAHCGRVKYVNVLVRVEFECPVCQYNWEPALKANASKPVANPVPAAAPPPPPAVDTATTAPGAERSKPLSWSSFLRVGD